MHFIEKSVSINEQGQESELFCICSSNESIPKELSTVQAIEKHSCLMEEFLWRRSVVCTNLPSESAQEPARKLSFYSESSISALLRDRDLTNALKSILILVKEGYKVTIPMLSDLFTASLDIQSADWNYFVELCSKFPSLLSEWFAKVDLAVSFAGKEDLSALFKIGFKTKRKTNFLFLLNKFLQSKSNSWLFFILIDWIKTTVIVRIDQFETLKEKFEPIFRLFGFDFYFANPYEFEPLFRVLFEAVQASDSNCAWKESIVVLLGTIVEILFSFSVQHQFTSIDTFAFHFFVQFKELPEKSMEIILKHVLCSFPSLRILVVWHLMQKRFRL